MSISSIGPAVLIRRLMTHCRIQAGPLATPCWISTYSQRGLGYLNGLGYPQIRLGTLWEQVHRASFQLFVGPLSEEKPCVLHFCDVKACFRPNHLHAGTRTSNAAERDDRGRTAQGSHHYRAKLSEEAVREIRERYRPYGRGGEMSLTRTLAREFGVAQETILSVVRRQNWKQVSS